MRYNAQMEQIARNIADIARNIEIVGADPITLHGFTQVPNFVLTQKELSVGAKLAYAMLLKYAWGDQACYPGQLKLAEDMGAAERSVRTYLKELETAGIPGDSAARPRQDQSLSPAPDNPQDRQSVASPDRQNLPVSTGNDCRSRTAKFAGHSI